jgi:hypothetical protein
MVILKMKLDILISQEILTPSYSKFQNTAAIWIKQEE